MRKLVAGLLAGASLLTGAPAQAATADQWGLAQTRVDQPARMLAKSCPTQLPVSRSRVRGAVGDTIAVHDRVPPAAGLPGALAKEAGAALAGRGRASRNRFRGMPSEPMNCPTEQISCACFGC